ncbi:putative S-acyltransferase [Platanthera zijinensis]|uniref:S-acyltransferase n=1 Tax=Platanthera zijinensis TaxID=2320716 RepID=A0AAP0BHC8_9ASPA
MKAAAKARASSSVLRPFEGHQIAETDSSRNASVRSSMSIDYGANKDLKPDLRHSPLTNSYPQSIAIKDDYEAGMPTASSLSSPRYVLEQPRAPSPLPVHPPPNPGRPDFPRGALHIAQPVNIHNPIFQSVTSLVRESRKSSVVWDQEAGRYVSVVPSSSRPENGEVPLRSRVSGTSNHSAEVEGLGRRPNPTSASSSSAPGQRKSWPVQMLFMPMPFTQEPSDLYLMILKGDQFFYIN